MESNNISKITEDLFLNTPDNITGVWYGYKNKEGRITNELSIIFNVKEKLPIEQIPDDELLPKEIMVNGKMVKTDVISENFRVFEECPSDFYYWTGSTPDNRKKVRPFQGGLQITNFTSLNGYYGTLGFLAEDVETNSLVGVTNNHVIIDDAFINSERINSTPTTNIAGDSIIQPSSASTDTIGVVKRYYPMYENGINYVDAALLTINSDIVDSNISYRQLNLTGYTGPLEFATTSEIDNLLSNNPNLFSSGARTGNKGEGDMKLLPFSIGSTQAVGGYNKQGSEYVVNFSDCIVFVASAATTPDGFICAYPINSGDSGSALLANLGGVRKIIGLCFAGSTFYGIANRIDRVANSLKIRSWTGQTTNYSDINNIQTVCLTNSSSDLTKTVGGNIYWQVGGCEI